MGFDFRNARRQVTAENASECIISIGVREHGLLEFVYNNCMTPVELPSVVSIPDIKALFAYRHAEVKEYTSLLEILKGLELCSPNVRDTY